MMQTDKLTNKQIHLHTNKHTSSVHIIIIILHTSSVHIICSYYLIAFVTHFELSYL